MKNLLSLLIFILSSFIENCIAQNIWEPTNGPNGLDIGDIVFSTDNVVAVALVHTGIFISKDNGVHWQKINKGIISPNGYTYQLVAGSNGIIYAVIDGDFYRLENNSDEWFKLKLPAGVKLVSNELGYLYYYYQGTFWYSYYTDKGEFFFKVNINRNFSSVGEIKCYGNDKNFFIATEGGITNLYKMNDKCGNIVKITNSSKSISDFIWHPDGYLFISYYDNTIIRMDEFGANMISYDSIHSRILKFALRSNGHLMGFSNEGDYETVDYGINWIKNASGIYQHMNRAIDVLYNGNNLFVYNRYCEYGQLQFTADEGINWNSFDQNFLNPTYQELFTDKSGRIFTKTCSYGRYSYSVDQGQSWQILKLPDEIKPAQYIISNANGDLFAISVSKLYKSSDLGYSWKQILIQGQDLFNSICSNGENIIYLFGGVNSFISWDDGDNWTQITAPPITVDNIYYHPDGTVFAVCYGFLCNDAIYYSVDEGLNWNLIPFPSIFSFCISKNGSIFIVDDNFDLKISKDKFKSIDVVMSNSEAVIADGNGNVYSTVSSGCSKSSDDGQNWEPFLSGLPTNPAYHGKLAIAEDNQLYFAMDYGVVYKTANTVTNTSSQYVLNTTKSVTIYPNPIENEMSVSISNKNIASGHYKIIDLNGIEKLKGEFRTNKFTIDCASLPNGMAYIQVFGAGKFYYTEKFVVVH